MAFLSYRSMSSSGYVLFETVCFRKRMFGMLNRLGFQHWGIISE